jgi:hypothetical protein
MNISFKTKEGVAAIRLATHDTASMLFRHADIPLDRYPTLRWQCDIEKGVDSTLDELTATGDDRYRRQNRRVLCRCPYGTEDPD